MHILQVMETERMIYLVTEYASGGEIFGKYLDYDEVIRNDCMMTRHNGYNFVLNVSSVIRYN